MLGIFAKRTRNGAVIVVRKLGKVANTKGLSNCFGRIWLYLVGPCMVCSANILRGGVLICSSPPCVSLLLVCPIHGSCLFASRFNIGKMFKGRTSIEVFEDCIVHKLQPQKVTLYENIRSGALVTNDVLSKYTANTCKCPCL